MRASVRFRNNSMFRHSSRSLVGITQYPNNLLFAVPCLLHLASFSVGSYFLKYPLIRISQSGSLLRGDRRGMYRKYLCSVYQRAKQAGAQSGFQNIMFHFDPSDSHFSSSSSRFLLLNHPRGYGEGSNGRIPNWCALAA
jgi:hypothetical protein